MQCKVNETGHIIGKKWTIIIMEEISRGKFTGFNEFLRKCSGITPRMLSQQLAELEEEGLITRKPGKTKDQKKTSFAITEKGTELHRIVVEMKKWNVKWNKVPSQCMDISCTECMGRKKA